MHRLETLGGLTLTDDAGRHVAPQRRRLALLALLAAAGDRGVTRDKLIACLWPESAADNARHALEQLLYSLRRQLPRGLVLGADPLRLDPAVVSTDVADFSGRLAAGDLAGAAAIYRGPFLDGFFLSGAPEFERWVDRERARLAGEQERALRALADEAQTKGRHTAEIVFKRRLASSDPLAERAAADLVRALAASGDWIGATRAAREYAARVREDLPGVPVRDLEALVERLRGERRLESGEDAVEAGGGAARTSSNGSWAGVRSRSCTWRATAASIVRWRSSCSGRRSPPPRTRGGSAGRSRFSPGSTIRTSCSSTTPASCRRDPSPPGCTTSCRSYAASPCGSG